MTKQDNKHSVTWIDSLNNANRLTAGMRIRVTFGSSGSQDAVIQKITSRGTVYAEKYRAKSDRWTKPVRIYEAEFLGRIS